MNIPNVMSCLILQGDLNGSCTCSSNSGILLTCLLCIRDFDVWNMLLLVPKISLCINIFCNSATFTYDYVMSIFLLTLYCWTDLLWGILLACCNSWTSCTINSCYYCRTCTFSTTSTKSWTSFSAPVCVRWILMLSSHPAFLIPPSGHYPRSHTKITYAFLVSPLQLLQVIALHIWLQPHLSFHPAAPALSCWLTNVPIQQFSGQTLPLWPHCVPCFGTSWHSWPSNMKAVHSVTIPGTTAPLIMSHSWRPISQDMHVWNQLSQAFPCLTQRNCLTYLCVMLRGDRDVHDSSYYQGLSFFVILGL